MIKITYSVTTYVEKSQTLRRRNIPKLKQNRTLRDGKAKVKPNTPEEGYHLHKLSLCSIKMF